MNRTATERLQESVASVAQRAREASRTLARLSCESRNEVLLAAAAAIEEERPRDSQG